MTRPKVPPVEMTLEAAIRKMGHDLSSQAMRRLVGVGAVEVDGVTANSCGQIVMFGSSSIKIDPSPLSVMNELISEEVAARLRKAKGSHDGAIGHQPEIAIDARQELRISLNNIDPSMADSPALQIAVPVDALPPDWADEQHALVDNAVAILDTHKSRRQGL
jgi:hypothetical protein